MRKILFVTSSFPRFTGDFAGNFIFGLAGKVAECGLKVHVLAPHDRSSRLSEYLGGLTVTRFPYFYPAGLQCLAYGGGISSNIGRSRLASIQMPLFFLSELLYAVALVLKENISVVHSHWLMPQGLVGAVCKKLLGTYHIATIHSSEVTLIKKLPLGRFLSEFILDNCDAVVSVSAHRADELLAFVSPDARSRIEDKVSIVPMGINVSEYAADKSREELKARHGIDSKNVILFVGRLVEVKGCEYLLKAFKEVLALRNDVELLIVGSGPLEAGLKAMAGDLGIEGQVKFEGFVEHDQVIDYYLLSDIVVFTSILDSHGFNEGLPLVLLETMATGKPVIATDVAGAREVIRDGWNGLLVGQKDPGQIAINVLKLLNDGALKAKFSANALVTAAEYDWDVIARKYARIMEGHGVVSP
jgi:glycosyltransferase involved in cell wall biosynthesis